MSVSVTWSVVPTEPKVLGGDTQPFKGWILHALGIGSLADVETHHLRDDPCVMEKNSRAHAYLQGLHDGMRTDNTDYEVLTKFLIDLDRFGKLLIGAE